MSDTQAATPAQDVLDKAVAEGGAYEVLHKRLLEQGQRLRQTAERLNASRLEEFGDSQMDVIGRVRIRTENNCIARDIVQVGDCLLFGYNVFIGLRKETGVADVFSLYRLVEGGETTRRSLCHWGQLSRRAGLRQRLQRALHLLQEHPPAAMAIRDGKLLASFQIGERITDIRVFRWSISSDGSEVRYIDNRGERDIALPAPFDFEWQRATREMVVEGRFHLNILDTLFVETIGGDLTIKVENNTEVGLGIYREEVMDKTQSLDDAQVEFARLGSLLLLKVLPYREEQWRYLVFNSLTGKVERIDAIGLACIQLPEDHGIIFPGGYYLQNGEYRTFEQSMEGMRFKRSVRSPNGEDVQYVFYHPEQGRNVLLTYNPDQPPVAESAVRPRLRAPGGRAHGDLRRRRREPTRIHPMQVWQTPFCTESTRPANRRVAVSSGGSAMPSGARSLRPLRPVPGDRDSGGFDPALLAAVPARLFDVYHWLGSDQLDGLAPLLREVATAEPGARRVREGREYPPPVGPGDGRRGGAAQGAALRLAARRLGPGAAVRRRAQRHHRPAWLTIREYRYIDVARLDAMEGELLAAHERVAAATATFLASEQALQPLLERLQSLDGEAQPRPWPTGEPLAALEAMAGDLDMLSSLMASLRIDDATQRTRIIESISEIYARLNQARAAAAQGGSSETVAQFGAQFKLFGQGITNP